MSLVKDYRDLEVWQNAMQVAELVYQLTQAFPQSEMYGLTGQMRRAALSIPANIAEGWERRYTAEFIQFLRKANGSRTELETHLIFSARICLCTEQDVEPILMLLQNLGRQLNKLERSLRNRTNQ